MLPFVPDNTTGQRVLEERENGPFRQDRFQQMHLLSIVKCKLSFRTYDDFYMRKFLTMLNGEAEIPTRLAMERDIERSLKHGKEEMKRALAMHTGKFAFTMTTKMENDPDGDSFHFAITAHWCTPDFRLVSALLYFEPAKYPENRYDIGPKTYADQFQRTLEEFGIWPRVSHVTWMDGGVFETDEVVRILAQRIPDFKVERDTSLCIMGKINSAMRRLQPIPESYPNPFWDSEDSDDPRMKEAAFTDTLISKYKEHGSRLFSEEDEVSPALVFPRLEELIAEVERFKVDESRPEEQLVKLKRTYNELMARHKILRKSPVYYMSLILNPRIKDQHTAKWSAEWRDACEAQLLEIWHSYKNMEEPVPVLRAVPQTPRRKRPAPRNLDDGEEEEEEGGELDDSLLSYAEYIAKYEKIAVKKWKDELYSSMTETAAAKDEDEIEDELERYRKQPIVPLDEWEKTFGYKLHNWWAAVGQIKFPRVAAMARDYLAIQASIQPVVEAFEAAAAYDSKTDELEEAPNNWMCPLLSDAARSAAILNTWWHKDVLGEDAVMHVPMGMRMGLEDLIHANETPFPSVGSV